MPLQVIYITPASLSSATKITNKPAVIQSKNPECPNEVHKGKEKLINVKLGNSDGEKSVGQHEVRTIDTLH